MANVGRFGSRIESSIITSLGELRAIEQQRIAEERAAVEQRAAREREAQQALEQARADAERARVEAERQERIRIEIARAEAEREARLRVEAAEAAERARLAAQLEERRMAEELELRRAEVARKRPTWMVAVTIAAGLAAVGLTWFAIDRSQQMAAAERQRAAAVRDREAAKDLLRETQVQLAALQKNIEEIDGRLSGLNAQLLAAQSDADRKRVAAEIAAASEQKRLANQRLAEQRRIQEKIERNKTIDVSKCVGTALGCLK